METKGTKCVYYRTHGITLQQLSATFYISAKEQVQSSGFACMDTNSSF